MTNALMIGTGEYTTGYVKDSGTKSDKKAGVVALTLFDLRRVGILDRLLMVGTNGTKFPGIRAHLQDNVQSIYRDMNLQFESFPADDVECDPFAYRDALSRVSAGDVVAVFTPDDSHFQIAMDAVHQGCHVLVAKPIVKTVDQHTRLAEAARENGCLVAMEVHKRWDPIYRDARDQIATLGEFSFFSSYMSQPKTQLDTFRAWAGKSSDISYYLNSHHIDFNVWSVCSFARPIQVFASASTGIAKAKGIDAEDTISLSVKWENTASGNLATAIYTASWAAPPADVHSQQRFFYMGQHGEIHVDQAHRGYSHATDGAGYRSPNPLFMKYTPDATGAFAGQDAYGYRSIADFVTAAAAVQSGDAVPDDFRGKLALIDDTLPVTAILEAGRMSLDTGQPIELDARGT